MPKHGLARAEEVMADSLAIVMMNVKHEMKHAEDEGRPPPYGPGFMQGMWVAAEAVGLESALRKALTIREAREE